jgi:hypothetical protein
MVNIDADAIFVAIVVDPIFLNPSSVQVFLAQAIWIFLAALRHPPRFDFLVPLAPVSLLRNWHKSRIDDLAAMGLQTLGSEVLPIQLKNRFDKTRFSQFEGLLRSVAFPKDTSANFSCTSNTHATSATSSTLAPSFTDALYLSPKAETTFKMASKL